MVAPETGRAGEITPDLPPACITRENQTPA